jgi:hypothetical protein
MHINSSASELVLRHYAFMQQVNPQEHAVLWSLDGKRFLMACGEANSDAALLSNLR